jgi:hypothetical protein
MLSFVSHPVGRTFFGERGNALRSLQNLAPGRMHPDEAPIRIVFKLIPPNELSIASALVSAKASGP